MSTVWASGEVVDITPFIAPTKWSVNPKSVVKVIRVLGID